MKKTNKIRSLAFTLSLCAGPAWSATCPTPPTNIEPTVQSRVTYDPKDGNYFYEYTLSNSKTSDLPIRRFVLLMDNAPLDPKGPQGWTAHFVSVQNLEKNLVWSTFALDPTDPNTRNKNYSGPPLKLYYSIKPGKSLGSFSFKSPYPPGPVHYFAEGETGVPMSTPTEYDDEPEPNCPGFNEGPRFKTMLGGTTEGPMPPGTIPVGLRLVKASGSWRAHECNPDRDTGEISVLMLPSRDFDPSTLTLSTVKFGYGEAPVLSSKAFPDFRDRAKENESARAKKKPLLLTFDVKAVGIRCGLDKAIFLEGKTSEGKSIVGSVPISTKDCKPWRGKKTPPRPAKPKSHH